MYDAIKNLLVPGKPRTILKWDKLISDTNTKLDIYEDRFLLSDINMSYATYLLKSILTTTDIPYLLKLDSDIDRYGKYLVYELDNLRTFFDPVYLKRPTYDCFIKSNGESVPEFILNVSYRRPLLDMPIDEPWEVWDKVSPVNMLYYDTLDFPRLLQYQFQFKTQPTYSVSSINISLLVLKFIHYLNENVPDLNPTFYHEHIDDYLKECVFVHLFENTLNVWCINALSSILNNENVLLKSYFIGSGITDAITDLKKVITQTKVNSITINDFAHTKFINYKSIVDTLNYYNNYLTLPPLRGYTYLAILRDIELITPMILLCKSSKSPIALQIMKKLQRVIRNYNNQNIVNTAPNKIKVTLALKIEKLSNLIY